MRIVAGAWRGRSLVAPPGQGTRPTADRVRQALFDMLMHAEWGGRATIEGAQVLDVFAGTGALGLEALSRGAASACFIESDAAAVRALRANIAACRAEAQAKVWHTDALLVPGLKPESVGSPMGQTRADDSRYRAVDPDRRHAASRATRREPETEAVTETASLVFLDPPYGQNLVARALQRLREVGRIRPDALIVAETGRDENWVPDQALLAERHHGAARILVFRAAAADSKQ